VVVERGSGRPIAGVDITMYSPAGAGGAGAFVTQKDGAFHLQLARGRFDLQVFPWELVQPKSIVVGDADQTALRVEVEPMGSIRGGVTRSGAGVAGASVRIAPSDQIVQTDSEGAYVARGLEPESYQITARTDELEASGAASSNPVLIRARETRDG